MKKLLLLLVLLLPICVYGIDTLVVFEDDLEGDVSGWTTYDETEPLTEPIYWHTSDFEAYSGESYWCGDVREIEGVTLSGYHNKWLQFLNTPAITLPASPEGALTLTFMHNYEIESYEGVDLAEYDGWDGMNVRLSVDGETFFPIHPTEAYPCTSMYGFGFNGEGPNMPGWGGSSDGWITETFDLSDFAGETVYIRFAFGSDPAFSTFPGDGDDTGDPDIWGWVVDNVVVTDGSDTLFFDDAGDTDSAKLTGSNGLIPHGDNWALTDVSSHSPSHSFNCSLGYNLDCSLISPSFWLPGGDTITYLQYWLRCDMADHDGNDDGYLEDYYLVYISTDDGATWERLFYDYMREESSLATTWNLWSKDSLFNGTMELSGWGGNNVKIKWTVNTDDNDDGGIGSGLYIDDVMVMGIEANHNDCGISAISTNPVNLNQNVQFTIKIQNYGLDDQSDVPAYYRVMDEGMTETLANGVLAPWASVTAGNFAVKTTVWRPVTPGIYNFVCWTGVAFDEDATNDTLIYTFEVLNSEYIELGYDDGMLDRTEEGYSYLGGDASEGAGVAVKFTAPSYDSLRLVGVKAYLGSMAPAEIIIYNDDGGPGSPIGSPTEIDPTVIGSFSTFDVDYQISSGQVFYISLQNRTEEMVTAGIDLTSPHYRTSYAYVPSLGWIYLADEGTYANYDLMIRAILHRSSTHAADNISSIPRFSLGNNYPNPFNPATAISYSIPELSDVKLEVFNLTGQKVKTVVNETQKAGNYLVRLDAGNLPSGIYFYKLTAGDNTVTKKMLLMK